MNFLIYILLFFLLNIVMSVSPFLGMMLYFAFIAYIISSSRKRMRSYSQHAYGQRNQQAYTNTNEQQYSQSNVKDEKKVKDAIDVEFTEEEIL